MSTVERSEARPAGTTVEAVLMDKDHVRFGYRNPAEGEWDGMAGELFFQHGPIGENGVNGVTNEAVIEGLVLRIQALNALFPCRENSLAITKLEEALHWLHARTADRQKRGVEGVNAP